MKNPCSNLAVHMLFEHGFELFSLLLMLLSICYIKFIHAFVTYQTYIPLIIDKFDHVIEWFQ